MYRPKLTQLFRSAGFPVDEFGSDHFLVTKEIIAELRSQAYLEQWRLCVANSWFHVKLEDHSVYIFNESGDKPSYSYLQCPLEVPSFREYLTSKSVDYNAKERVGYQDEYQNVIATAQLRPHVCPIRYDFDPSGYRAGIHPLAHIHIGLQNSIRLAVRRKMSAVSFTLFTMRQLYPECWGRLVEEPDRHRLPQRVRHSLEHVEETYWSARDSVELSLA